MGLKFTGESLKNSRICSRHFTPESYQELSTHRLRGDALLILFPVGRPIQDSQEVVDAGKKGV